DCSYGFSLSFHLFSPIALTCAEPVKFADCASAVGTVVIVDIHPCPKQPCQLHKGQAYAVNVTFNCLVESQTSRAIVHGVITHIPIPIEDGCKSDKRETFMHCLSNVPYTGNNLYILLVPCFISRNEISQKLMCIVNQ
uniref:MD-2-related lipid-recognition domain-containing protein n=1 Tax=Salmo trutta TaxID=8032 RepID=A0A673X773_SALTR